MVVGQKYSLPPHAFLSFLRQFKAREPQQKVASVLNHLPSLENLIKPTGPGAKGRKLFLSVHIKKKPLRESFSTKGFQKLARGSEWKKGRGKDWGNGGREAESDHRGKSETTGRRFRPDSQTDPLVRVGKGPTRLGKNYWVETGHWKKTGGGIISKGGKPRQTNRESKGPPLVNRALSARKKKRASGPPDQRRFQ